IEPAEVWAARRGFRARTGKPVLRIEADLIVHLPLLWIAQHVVRFLNVLETLLGRFVARVQIGVIFTREFPVRLTDFLGRGVPRLCTWLPPACGWPGSAYRSRHLTWPRRFRP